MSCGIYFGYVANNLSAANTTDKRLLSENDARSTEMARKLNVLIESNQKHLRPAPQWFNTETNEELRQRREKLVAGIAPIDADAELRMYKNQIRVRLKYQRLYRELNLSADQIQKFETAAAKEFGAIDIFGLTLGQYPSDEEARHLESIARNLDKVVLTTLGDEAVPAFRDYVATRDLEEEVSRLTVNCFNIGTPLTPEQTNQLLLLCAENCESTGQEVRINPRSVDWTAVESAAERFLTPLQLDALRRQNAIKAFDAEFTKITGLPYRRPVRGL